MPPQQTLVELSGLWTQARTLGYPRLGVLLETDPGRVRVDPLATEDLGFLLGQPDLGVTLALEGMRCRTVTSSGPRYRT